MSVPKEVVEEFIQGESAEVEILKARVDALQALLDTCKATVEDQRKVIEELKQASLRRELEGCRTEVERLKAKVKELTDALTHVRAELEKETIAKIRSAVYKLDADQKTKLELLRVIDQLGKEVVQ